MGGLPMATTIRSPNMKQRKIDKEIDKERERERERDIHTQQQYTLQSAASVGWPAGGLRGNGAVGASATAVGGNCSEPVRQGAEWGSGGAPPKG